MWFGPDDRLFGWFHSPAGLEARGGVLVCPPLAREYLDSQYALRVLAEALTARGLCTVRFDYDGTGDSAGDHSDLARVDAWLTSIAHGVSLLREAGSGPVSVVGLRLGAALAAFAAQRDGCFDGLVLWDPVVSGRRYLAEQRALTALSSRASQHLRDGSVEAPGIVFGPATVGDIGALNLTDTKGRLAKRVLIAGRSDRPYGDLAEHLSHPGVEWCDASGLVGLMDVESPHQVLPDELIRRTADWIIAGLTAPAKALSVPARPRATVVGYTRTGAPVVEEATTIAPAGLFAISTRVPGPAAGPTAVFLNVANEHRTGPARLWVDLARRWADHGIPSLRVDMSGLGDSPTREVAQPRFVARLPVAFDDVRDASRCASPEDPSDVVLIGLCSSAYQALDSALELRPRGVVAVQPVLSFQPPEVLLGGSVDPRRRFAMPRSPLVEAFHDEGPLSFLRRRFPNLGWRLRAMTLAHRGPKRWLRELNRSGSDVLVICGEWESRPFRHALSRRAMERLSGSGRFRFEYMAALEHGLLRAAQRTAVSDLITDHVVGRFGVPVAAAPDASVQRSRATARTGS